MTDLITSGGRLRGRVARPWVDGRPATIDCTPGRLVRAFLGHRPSVAGLRVILAYRPVIVDSKLQL